MQASLEMATDIITDWLNVGRVNVQKTAGTDSAPSDHDGSVHSFILHVRWGVTVKIFFACEENETDFVLWKPS